MRGAGDSAPGARGAVVERDQRAVKRVITFPSHWGGHTCGQCSACDGDGGEVRPRPMMIMTGPLSFFRPSIREYVDGATGG